MKSEIRFIADLHLRHINVIKFTESSYKNWKEIEVDHKKMISMSPGALKYLCWEPIKIPQTIDEWDNLIKTNWNSVVKNNDVTYIAGDITVKTKIDFEYVWNFLNDLNGEIHIVPGNHDYDFLKHIYKNHLNKFNGYWNGMLSKCPKKAKIYVEPEIIAIKVPSYEDGVKAANVTISHYPIYCFDKCGFGGTLIWGHVHNIQNQLFNFIMSMSFSSWSEISEYGKAMHCPVSAMLPYMNFTPRTLDELTESFIKKLI